MAVQPDLDRPVFGYFVTPEFSEVHAYINALLESQRTSFVFLLHASAIFEKDGEREELHLPNNANLIFDPQMPEDMVDMLLDEQRALCQEPEHFMCMQGSGWTFVPGTLRYWFKVYACQPNNHSNPSSQNVSDNGTDPDDPAHYPESKLNFFLLSICEFYARKESLIVPRELMLKWNMLEKYGIEKMHIPEGDFTLKMQLQDIPEYHKNLNLFNVRIFSMRGNVLYAKKYQDNDEWIDLYMNSYNRISLVLNLWALFKKKHDRFFCMSCLKWGNKNNHNCEKVLLSSRSDEINIPDIPLGRHHLVAYADFESAILRDGFHKLTGWGCAIIDVNNEVYDTHNMNLLQAVNNEDIIKTFVEYLTALSTEFASQNNITDELCGICRQPVYDHDDAIYGTNFINGNSGAHHYNCWNHPKNTMYCFFHNFRGYDSHFLIKKLVHNTNIVGLSATSMEKFNVIAINGWEEENNMQYDKPYIRITFKDTFNFFTCSLAKCVSMIEDWRYTPEDARNDKGLFPYDWFDSTEKLWAEELPPAPWHNLLTNSVIDPTPAFELWQRKGFRRFYEFHDYYMMIDVFQLADAFEEFRRTCVSEFQTDPAHFQGAPSLTWYLGVASNPDMFKIILDKGIYMDIQNNIRGGISQAMVRYCNVEDKPEQSMFFLDVNSLYSKCMTYKMPGKLLYSTTEVPENWRELFNENTNETAILSVDLVYPPHLHDRDWAYPLAPHHYNDRLCTTFKRRENYMVHAELLAFYLDRGLILEDIHYMYVFHQDYTLRDYVQSNIEKRRHTNSEVMKTLYKLLNNSLYGKTCENVHKYRKFEVVVDESLEIDDPLLAQAYNTNFSDCINLIECGDRFLVEKRVTEVRLNKPIQIGFAILEFAKREIYKFLAAVTDHFGDKCIPLYTDTDSILFWCDFPEPWKHFYNSPLLPFLDFDKVPDTWGVKTKDTDKQSGLWSPEAGGKEIVEYVGLRAKTYAYRFRDNSTVIKNKGVPKAAQIANYDETPREAITIDHYRSALFEGNEYHITQYAIRSFQHEVITRKEYKLGISANDMKRAVTANRAISLPFGYQGATWKHLVTDDDDPDLLDA